MKVLKPNKNRVTQGYSDKHKGYDHSGSGDQNYYSSFFGKVVQSKNSETKNWINAGTLTTADYGNYIKIKSEVDGKVVYQLGAHFKQGTVLPVGAEVKKGQVVAQIGNTGNSTAAHSHTEYRDESNANFPVEFVDEEVQAPIMDKSKEQLIIDAYKAITGEYPSDDEKKARLQKNENTVELIEDLLRGDGRAKKRWLEEWNAEDNDIVLQKTVTEYETTLGTLKEILKVPYGSSNEVLIGKAEGMSQALQEAQKALIPKVVYRYQDKDYQKILTIGNIVLILEK